MTTFEDEEADRCRLLRRDSPDSREAKGPLGIADWIELLVRFGDDFAASSPVSRAGGALVDRRGRAHGLRRRAPQDLGQRSTWKAGAGVAVNGPKGRTTNLATVRKFGDIEAHVEFMIPSRSNSGVYFQGRYELQVYDSYGVAKDQYPGIECGGLYPRWRDNHEIEGHSPRVTPRCRLASGRRSTSSFARGVWTRRARRPPTPASFASSTTAS